MLKRLAAMAAVLAVTLAAMATPVLAQEEEVSRTGVIERFEGEDAPCLLEPTHALGISKLGSSGGADLDAYVGQQVTVYGELVKNPTVVGSERCPEIDVSRVEPANPDGSPPEATAPGTTTTPGRGSPSREATSASAGAEGAKVKEPKEPGAGTGEKKKKKELPSTGGTDGGGALLALGAGALLVGGGLLARGLTRR